MTDEEEQIPGVTLWFKRAAVIKSHNPKEKYRVDLHLDAVVADEVLWAAIAEKFRAGLRLYTRPDFHEEVIGVMGKKSREFSERITLLEKELAREKDLRRQAESELAKYKEPLAAFGRGLRGGSEG